MRTGILHLKNIRVCTLLATVILLLHTTNVQAQNHAPTNTYSTSATGMLGLNTIPNARFDSIGTVRAGFSTLDPYAHAFMGIQLAKPLYINLRQSAETSDILTSARRLYPGLDFKIRLLDESDIRPAIALGVQSATGHKRMSGEYLAFSKRFKNIDFTAGLGWGRYGSAGRFKNPLSSLNRHFDTSRSLDGESPSKANDWFTGQKIGLFGGVEYFTPLKNLSIKFDWGADRYSAEQQAFNFENSTPWALGLNYKARPWTDMSVAMLGQDTFMGRLSFQSPLSRWRNKNTKYNNDNSKATLHPVRTAMTKPQDILSESHNDGIHLQSPFIVKDYTARADLLLSHAHSTPYQIGRAAIHMSNNVEENIENITLNTFKNGLRGPSVHLLRKDFENAILKKQGSPEEIWRNASFNISKKEAASPSPFLHGHSTYNLELETQISLAEEDTGILYRNSLIAHYHPPQVLGILNTYGSLRLNINNNLSNIDRFRSPTNNTVRGDVEKFTNKVASLDTAFASFDHTFSSSWHSSLSAGYLEEMYAGAGGEILYHPFKSRLALGAQAWHVKKRDPASDLNLNLTSNATTTGGLQAWYDLPRHDLTLNANIGRYLSEDFGATLGLEKHFKNGVKLSGFLTLSDQNDSDIFGGKTHAHHAIRLSLPLGGYAQALKNTNIAIKTEPFGRNSGQTLQIPHSLYDRTSAFSYDHLARHWHDVLPK